MRYCITYPQPSEYLQKADEFLIHYIHVDSIPDIYEAYPNKVFTVYISMSDDKGTIDWKKLEQYNIICRKNLQVCLEDENDIYMAREANINYFMAPIVRDFFTFHRYRSMGVNSIRVTAPITNYMDYVKTFSVEIRVFPTESGIVLFDEEFDGVPGGWIRPEDLDNIKGIDVAEFMAENKKREQALFRIYAEEKAWSGNLDYIINNLGMEGVMNRMIPPEFQEARNNCKQKCQSGGQCRLCYSYLRLANPELLKQGLKNNELSNVSNDNKTN